MNDADGTDYYAAEVAKYKHLCGILHDALAFYANPETYHAIMIVSDRPAGGFASDLDLSHGHPDYAHRRMPGTAARAALKRAEAEYGDLKMYSEADQ